MKIIKKLSISTFVLASAISIVAVSSQYAPILASEKLKKHSSVSITELENNSNEIEINLFDEDEFFIPSTLSLSMHDDSFENAINFMQLSENHHNHEHNHEDQHYENDFRIIRYCACCDNDYHPSSCRQTDLAIERAREADRIAKENGIETRKIYSYDEAKGIGNKISLHDKRYINSLLPIDDETIAKKWEGAKLVLKIPPSVCSKIVKAAENITAIAFGMTEFLAELCRALAAINPELAGLAFWIGLVSFVAGLISFAIMDVFLNYVNTGIKFIFLFGFIYLGKEKLG